MNGMFGVNGLLGLLVAVVLLLTVVFIFGVNAVSTQKREATNYYKIEKPFGINMIDTNNVSHVKDAK